MFKQKNDKNSYLNLGANLSAFSAGEHMIVIFLL